MISSHWLTVKETEYIKCNLFSAKITLPWLVTEFSY